MTDNPSQPPMQAPKVTITFGQALLGLVILWLLILYGLGWLAIHLFGVL